MSHPRLAGIEQYNGYTFSCKKPAELLSRDLPVRVVFSFKDQVPLIAGLPEKHRLAAAFRKRTVSVEMENMVKTALFVQYHGKFFECRWSKHVNSDAVAVFPEEFPLWELGPLEAETGGLEDTWDDWLDEDFASPWEKEKDL